MDDNTGDFQLERDKDRALSLRVTKMSLKGGEAGVKKDRWYKFLLATIMNDRNQM